MLEKAGASADVVSVPVARANQYEISSMRAVRNDPRHHRSLIVPGAFAPTKLAGIFLPFNEHVMASECSFGARSQKHLASIRNVAYPGVVVLRCQLLQELPYHRCCWTGACVHAMPCTAASSAAVAPLFPFVATRHQRTRHDEKKNYLPTPLEIRRHQLRE